MALVPPSETGSNWSGVEAVREQNKDKQREGKIEQAHGLLARYVKPK